MSTLLSAQSLCYNLSTSSLFDGVTITLKKSDRIGLIGHNGCGKSTLLQLLKQTIPPSSGDVNVARHCRIASVEQHLPTHLLPLSLVYTVSERLLLSVGERELSQHSRLEPAEPLFERGPCSSVSAKKGSGGEEKANNAFNISPDRWKVELLLSQLGFSEEQWLQTADQLSGGQHSRLLLARALVTEPDLLLLDEPSNHLDLPSLLWLESFLLAWSGSFVLVSHDQRLLDKVTNCTWIIRDQHILRFQLPCSLARQALLDKEATDAERYRTEQQEIQRIEKSAKRLAIWGREFDNESLARKAKSMGKRVDQLKEQQTVLSSQLPWCLQLKGEALAANRLLAIQMLYVCPTPFADPLFYVENQRLKSGDRVAILGQNGVGKSSLLRMLWGAFLQANNSDKGSTAQELNLVVEESVQFHSALRLGYYDQSLQQLADDDCLIDALYAFAPLPQEERKMALIRAGFDYQRHSQKIAQLSGGERARVLFIGLTLARYHLLFLDEPTNHLDMEGKSELAATLNQYEGAVVLVSHDRDFIERSCQRFWVVSEQKVSGLQSLPLLQEYYDAESAYHALLNVQGSVVKTKYGQGAIVANNCEPQSDDSKLEDLTGSVTDREVDNQAGKCFESNQEQLLQRVIELEALLKQDEGQSVKKQKPKQQQRWREEIFTLNQRLE